MKYLIKSFATVLGISTLLVVGGAFNKPAKGEYDFPTLNTQVQNQQKELDNHEARITNVEADVQVVQQANQTAPAPHQAVPDATPAPAPAPTPDPTPAPTPNWAAQNPSVNSCNDSSC